MLHLVNDSISSCTGITKDVYLKDFTCQGVVADLLKRVGGLQAKIARDHMKVVFVGRYGNCPYQSILFTFCSGNPKSITSYRRRLLYLSGAAWLIHKMSLNVLTEILIYSNMYVL